MFTVSMVSIFYLIYFCNFYLVLSDRGTDPIVFPDSSRSSSYSEHHDTHDQGHYESEIPPAVVQTNFSSRTGQVPLDLVQRLNDVDGIDKLFSHFVDNPEEFDEYPVLSSRFGGGVERANALMPKAAGCSPELKAIPLKDVDSNEDPSMLYYPACTKVERCGGCCSHALLECQPAEDGVEIINFKVVVLRYKGLSDKLSYNGKEIIPVERHTKCKCDCKIKETDCTEFQIYSKNECRCKCKNFDDERKCERNSKKIWDPSLCVCRCREGLECSTGFFYNLETCECDEDTYITRRSVEFSPQDIEKIKSEREKFKLRLGGGRT